MKARASTFCFLVLSAVGAAGAVSAQGAYTTFGRGCPGSKGLPTLSATGDHKIGGTTTIRVANLVPNQAGVLLFGVSNTRYGRLTLPADLRVVGMPGCLLLVSAEATLPVGTGSGLVAAPFRHPVDRNLIGATFYNQYAAVDPGARTPIHVVVSNGGKLTVGPACKDGAVNRKSQNFKFRIPPIKQLNTPPIDISGSFAGQTQFKCCAGPLQPTRKCTFSGQGTATGTTGPFSIPIPPDVAKQLSTVLCAEVRKSTGGIVTCTLTFNQVSTSGARIDGRATAFRNDCAGTFGYTGGGGITFGKVSTTVRAHFKITILFTFRFSTDIDVTAQPVGSWKIASNKISASARIPSITASKEFKILGIPIRIRKTFNTPQLSGSTPAVALPPLPVSCD